MDRENLLEEREGMVIRELLLDELAETRSMKEDAEELFKALKDSGHTEAIVEIKANIKALNAIFNNLVKLFECFDEQDILNMEEKHKKIIIALLKRRIDNVENSDSEDEENSKLKESIDKLQEFIIYEYKTLLLKYLTSIK